MQSCHLLRPHAAIEHDLLSAQQCLAKPAALDEVEILLLHERVVSGEPPQRLDDRFWINIVLHFEKIGFTQIRESVAAGMRGEFVEVRSVVGFRQIVVIKEPRFARGQMLQLLREQRRGVRMLRAYPASAPISWTPCSTRRMGSSTSRAWYSIISRNSRRRPKPGLAL